MDNQGSNSFNNNQSATPRDANFWNPVPPQSQQSTQLTPSVQTPQSYVSTSTSSAPVSQNNNYNTQSYGQPSSTYQPYNSVATPQSSTIPQTSQSFTSANNTSFATQVTDPSGNLLSKDFNLMTDEEKKEAERIARAKNRIDLLKTIGLIVVSLLAVLFIGLFIWMTLKWSEANTNVQGKIDVAVAEARNSLQTKLEGDFEEKEKYPFLTFSGPTDLGSLNFEYPKTWNLYVPDDASRGGDYHAYLNPGQVNVVDDSTVMALRVTIKSEQMDRVLEDYTRKVESGEMTVSSTVVNGVNVSVYTGKLDSDLMGIVCIFKIRDKTAILQTDSSNVFRADFERILSTIRFNN
ncbi:MAG: hypothetical protein ACFNPW_01550 [Candidatus Nanosyncoccus sp.]|jgi:hypothetical protein cdivTM_09948